MILRVKLIVSDILSQLMNTKIRDVICFCGYHTRLIIIEYFPNVLLNGCANWLAGWLIAFGR